MMEKLPKKLSKEPLIDAIFEIRFTPTIPASNVLPGYLFSRLAGEKNIENLPAHELPKQIRDADPNLQFAPLLRLNWSNFSIGVGDLVVSIACKFPYPGWTSFKEAIIKIIGEIKGIGIITELSRYSMKYVDILDSFDTKEPISLFNVDLAIGNEKIRKENFHIRTEIERYGFKHLINIASSATIVMPQGIQKQGHIVDIDTIVNTQEISLDTFLKNLPKSLEDIHDSTKSMFFECLRKETIKDLGPIYD